MNAYILRRVFLFVPTLFGVSLILFLMLHVIPGDYATAVLLGGEEARDVTAEDLERVREKLGLNGSLVSQYGRWVVNSLQGDLGTSFANARPVLDRLVPRIALSAELAFLTVALSAIIAIPGGIAAAVRQDKWLDYGLRFFSILFESMPGFWVALMVIMGLLWAFEWIPPIQYRQVWEDPWRNFQTLVFPALALGLASSAGILRMTRSSVLEVLRDDFVRTAHSKGLRPNTILFVHVLRNALLPVVTLVGFELVIQIGGQVVIEQVFNLPGLGKLLVQSVASRDYPVIQAIVMFIAAVVLLANLFVDLLYAWLDPRIHYA